MAMIFINRNRQSLGQFDEQDVADGLKSGKFLPEDLAWQEPMDSWKPLAEFSNLPSPSESSGLEPCELQGDADGIVTGAAAAPRQPDGKLDIGKCMEAGWNCFTIHWGNLVLGTLIIIALSIASQIPVQACQFVFEMFKKHGRQEPWLLVTGGVVFFFFWVLAMIASALLKGGFLYFLLTALRRTPNLSDLFAGFKESTWLQLVLGMLLTAFIVVGAMAPCFLLIGWTAAKGGMSVLSLLEILFLLLPGIYLAVVFYYAPVLIIDRKMDFWEAMQRSRRIVHSQWFPVFGLMLLAGLVSLLGILLCCVGLLATVPIGHLWLMEGYRQLFGESTEEH